MATDSANFERPPASFSSDVSNPVNIEAEERVLHYLRDVRGWAVRDLRLSNTSHDFALHWAGKWRTVDVKADSLFHKSQNIVFESHNTYRDGTTRQTWGYADDLDFLAVVDVAASWQMWLIELRQFRYIVTLAEESGESCLWKSVSRDNGPYVTHGYCVPVSTLIRQQAVKGMTILKPAPQPVPRSEPQPAR